MRPACLIGVVNFIHPIEYIGYEIKYLDEGPPIAPVLGGSFVSLGRWTFDA